MGEVTKFPGGQRAKQDEQPAAGLSLVLSFPLQEYASQEEIEARRAQIEVELEKLRVEHRALDEALDAAERNGPLGRLDVQRLKKQKLALKDVMTQLSSQLLPDIIA